MPPTLGDESPTMSNTAKSLNTHEDFHSRKAAGVGGYALQIIFQVLFSSKNLAQQKQLLCRNPMDLHRLAMSLSCSINLTFPVHI